MAKKPRYVRVYNRQSLTASLSNPTVTVLMPDDLLPEIKRISALLQGLKIYAADRSMAHPLSTIEGLITPEQLQLLARTERSNTNGVVDYGKYYPELPTALVHQIKRLAKQCVVAGVSDAIAWGGFHCKRILTEKRPFILLDLAGLQFQQPYNTGSLVVISKNPDSRTAGGEKIFQTIMGEHKTQFKECAQNPERYVQTAPEEFFDRYAYRQMVARDFLLAEASMQIAYRKSAREEAIVLRFAHYGCGYFAADLTKSAADKLHTRFQKVLNLEIFEGVYLGLRQYFTMNSNPKADRRVHAIEFPHYTEWRDQTPEEKNQVRLMVALIEDLCRKHDVEVRFSSEDLMKPDSEDRLVAASNGGDSHATAGNEMGSGSLDAAVATNLFDKAAAYSLLSNAGIGSELFTIPHFGYYNDSLRELKENLDKYINAEDNSKRPQLNRDVAQAFKAYAENSVEQDFFNANALRMAGGEACLWKGQLSSLVIQYIKWENPSLKILDTQPAKEAAIKGWLKSKKIIFELCNESDSLRDAEETRLDSFSDEANIQVIFSAIEDFARRPNLDEKTEDMALALHAFIGSQLPDHDSFVDPNKQMAAIVQLVKELGLNDNSNIKESAAWETLIQPELLSVIFPYVRLMVPHSQQSLMSTDLLAPKDMQPVLHSWLHALVITAQCEDAYQDNLENQERRNFEQAEIEKSRAEREDLQGTIEQTYRLIDDSEQRAKARAAERAKENRQIRQPALETPNAGDSVFDLRQFIADRRRHKEEKAQADAADAIESKVADPQGGGAAREDEPATSLQQRIEDYIETQITREKERYGITDQAKMRAVTKSRLAIAEAMLNGLKGTENSINDCLSASPDLVLVLKNDLSLSEFAQELSSTNADLMSVFNEHKESARKIQSFFRERTKVKQSLGEARTNRGNELLSDLHFYRHFHDEKEKRSKQHPIILPTPEEQELGKQRVKVVSAFINYFESKNNDPAAITGLDSTIDFDAAVEADLLLRSIVNNCIRFMTGGEVTRIADVVSNLAVMQKMPAVTHLRSYAKTLSAHARTSTLAETNTLVANTALAVADYLLDQDNEKFINRMDTCSGWTVLETDRKIYQVVAKQFNLPHQHHKTDFMSLKADIERWADSLRSGGGAAPTQ